MPRWAIFCFFFIQKKTSWVTLRKTEIRLWNMKYVKIVPILNKLSLMCLEKYSSLYHRRGCKNMHSHILPYIIITFICNFFPIWFFLLFLVFCFKNKKNNFYIRFFSLSYPEELCIITYFKLSFYLRCCCCCIHAIPLQFLSRL